MARDKNMAMAPYLHWETKIQNKHSKHSFHKYTCPIVIRVAVNDWIFPNHSIWPVEFSLTVYLVRLFKAMDALEPFLHVLWTSHHTCLSLLWDCWLGWPISYWFPQHKHNTPPSSTNPLTIVCIGLDWFDLEHEYVFLSKDIVKKKVNCVIEIINARFGAFWWIPPIWNSYVENWNLSM